jgi:hypothetical protein
VIGGQASRSNLVEQGQECLKIMAIHNSDVCMIAKFSGCGQSTKASTENHNAWFCHVASSQVLDFLA